MMSQGRGSHTTVEKVAEGVVLVSGPSLEAVERELRRVQLPIVIVVVAKGLALVADLVAKLVQAHEREGRRLVIVESDDPAFDWRSALATKEKPVEEAAEPKRRSKRKRAEPAGGDR